MGATVGEGWWPHGRGAWWPLWHYSNGSRHLHAGLVGHPGTPTQTSTDPRPRSPQPWGRAGVVCQKSVRSIRVPQAPVPALGGNTASAGSPRGCPGHLRHTPRAGVMGHLSSLPCSADRASLGCPPALRWWPRGIGSNIGRLRATSRTAHFPLRAFSRSTISLSMDLRAAFSSLRLRDPQAKRLPELGRASQARFTSDKLSWP